MQLIFMTLLTLDSYGKRYIDQPLSGLLKQIGSSNRSPRFKDNPPIENLNDHEYHFNQHKNNLRQCDKKELSPCQFEVKSMESQMTEDFSKRKTTVEKILVSKDRSKSR